MREAAARRDVHPLAMDVDAGEPPDVVVEVDSSYDGPYGGPMDPAAQARFDASWPREAAHRNTVLALARQMALHAPPNAPPLPFPRRFIGVWVWNTGGPLLVRHTAVFADGTLQRVEAGEVAPRLEWLPTDNGWSSSVEGRKTLETVHTRVDCESWSQHRKLAFLAWADGLGGARPNAGA
jgi:hypothetical protein